MLDDLVGVIETIQLRIREHRPSLSPNETRTRLALIDPLLTVLGWEVSDPGVVTPEYDVGGGRADYALLDAQSKPIAFIEAKHLDAPLESDRNEEQVVTYATRQRLRFVGLTNGDRWVFDDLAVFSTGRRRLDLTISNTPAHQCALQMLLLWRPNLSSGEPVLADEPVLGLDRNPVAMTDESRMAAAVLPDHVPATGSWVRLAEFVPLSGTTAPSAIRFPDAAEWGVQFWWQLIRASAEWLHVSGNLTPDKVPVLSARQGYILHTDSVHPSGKAFSAPADVRDTNYRIEAHGNAYTCYRRARLLLERCGVDPGDVYQQTG